MSISFIVTTFSRAVLRGQREAARGCRRVACRALFGSVFALLVATPVTQAGPLRPGEILVADSGFEDLADGAIFRVDPVTGDRAIISGRGVGSGPELFNPLGITLGADRQIYVTDRVVDEYWVGTPFVYRIDPISGHRVEVSGPNVGTGPSLGDLTYGITASTAGSLYVVTDQADLAGPFESGAVFVIDPATGNRSVLTGPGTAQGPALQPLLTVRVDLNGSLLAVSSGLTRVDSDTGDREIIRPHGSFFGTDAAVQDAFSFFVAASDEGRIYKVDRASGFQEIVTGQTWFDGLRGSGPLLWPFSLEMEESGQLIGSGGVFTESDPGPIGANFAAGVFRVDIATGDRSVVSGPGVGLGPELIGHGFMMIVPVPEPSALAGALAGIAVLAMGHWLRRKR